LHLKHGSSARKPASLLISGTINLSLRSKPHDDSDISLNAAELGVHPASLLISGMIASLQTATQICKFLNLFAPEAWRSLARIRLRS